MDLPGWLTVGLEIAGLLGGLIAAVGTVTMWGMSHSTVSAKDFADYLDRHEKRHDALDQRLERGERKFATVDADMKHAPGNQDVNDLRNDIADLKGSMRALSVGANALESRVAHIEHQVDRLVDFHLQGGK
jgi:hypothetical protein